MVRYKGSRAVAAVGGRGGRRTRMQPGRACARLIREKRRKGYGEVAAPEDAAPEDAAFQGGIDGIAPGPAVEQLTLCGLSDWMGLSDSIIGGDYQMSRLLTTARGPG